MMKTTPKKLVTAYAVAFAVLGCGLYFLYAVGAALFGDSK